MRLFHFSLGLRGNVRVFLGIKTKLKHLFSESDAFWPQHSL